MMGLRRAATLTFVRFEHRSTLVRLGRRRFLSWLESKIQQVPVQHVIREKYLRGEERKKSSK
jgi:hypothetical protein